MNRVQSLKVDARFCGPNDMGNGGYVCGIVAEAIDGPAQVRLRLPTPLDTALRLESDGSAAQLWDGEALLAEGRGTAGQLDLDPPPRPTDDEVREARPHFPGPGQHMAPNCFVCGISRAPDDGLCVFSGRHPHSGHSLAHWIPAADLADESRLVAVRYIWSVLDCPSYFAFGKHERVALLADMETVIARRPLPGEKLTVTGWTLRHDGRKHYTASVLHDEGGQAIALAKTLWVDVGAVGA